MIIKPQSLDLPHHFNPNTKGKSLERDNKNKSPEFVKVSSTTKYYKCQGYGHLAASCPNLVKITIIDGTPTEVTESDTEEYTYHPKVVETDESSSDDVGLNCIRPTPSTHLPVVKCVLFQLARKDDWRRTATFHTFTKIGDKSCKVIVNSENCINAISSRLYENLGLEIIHIYSTCHGLTPRHLRSNNDVLFQSVLIIMKTRFGVM